MVVLLVTVKRLSNSFTVITGPLRVMYGSSMIVRFAVVTVWSGLYGVSNLLGFCKSSSDPFGRWYDVGCKDVCGGGNSTFMGMTWLRSLSSKTTCLLVSRTKFEFRFGSVLIGSVVSTLSGKIRWELKSVAVSLVKTGERTCDDEDDFEFGEREQEDDKEDDFLNKSDDSEDLNN